MGSIPGALIGGLFVGVVESLVLILVVGFAPRGVAGAVARLRGWLMPPAKTAREAAYG